MPKSAQQPQQDGDASRVQSTCSEMAEQAALEARQKASLNQNRESGVSILPIPPALDFPYPEKKKSDKSPASESDRLDDPPPAAPPKKSVTTPLEPSTSNIEGRRGSLGTPNLLTRIGSAPIRPSGFRKYGSEGPSQLRRGSSVLQKLSSRKKKEMNDYFDPSVCSDYQESSSEDDEDNHDTQRSAKSKRLQRSSTAPSQKDNSNPYKRFAFGNDSYQTRGHVSKHDGRLNISVNETANKGYLARALGASLQHHLGSTQYSKHKDQTLAPLRREDKRKPKSYRQESASAVSDLSVDDPLPLPKMNIVVMVIGSRGDIQPFLRLGKLLREEHGHRVRIATHPTFKQFVEEDAKLEFFDVGGDPAELMAFMVKNPGLIPKPETLRSGEIPRRRAQMFEMFKGFWRACISSGDQEMDPSKDDFLQSKDPFVADAIIANPPSFAHIHCAERLGIPLHLMFTFPNTPTQQFPHPLTNIRQSNVDANYTNFMSYPLVEMMQWQGLGDLINEFRVKTLGLDPMSMLWAPGQVFRMKVPYSYLWSPGLIPKPPDWGDEIDITGFVFLDLASSFKPPDALAKFLDAGEPPIYIGFGSIVVDDPDKFTSLIFEAVEKAGVRALVSKGWGGLGAEDNCPDNIFMLDNTPHDWLFPRVSAVVHHGGAGTTAIGLKCGKPTMIVPFFGDQPFWGAMVAKSNAGADPVPYKQLSAEKLAEGIKLLLTEEKQKGAKALAEKIASEGDGAVNAVKSFHKNLPRQGVPNMRCSILRDRVAAWHVKGTEVRLSGVAAQALVQQKRLDWGDLRLDRVFDWNDFEGPGEPITGFGSSLLASLVGIGAGMGKIPFHWEKVIKKKEARDRRRRQLQLDQRRSEANKEDKKLQKKGRDYAKREAEKEIARHSKQPEQNKSQVGLEAKLPDSNQPSQPKLDEKDESESESEIGEIFQQLAFETGRGFRESGSALVKLPMEMSLALAQGFHNAPRLYGDDSVRTGRRITGFHSGCRAATSELVHGVFDGVTGIVRQPYVGAKYDGTLGFFKGIGKGFGGFIIKDFAALLGVPAYTLKGLHKEMTKHRQPTAFIRRARIVESAKQFAELSDQDRKDLTAKVTDGWEIVEDVRAEIRKTIKEKGVRGRVEVWRNRRWLKENGVIWNIRGLQRALDAHREGRDWEVEFHEERERHQREQARVLRACKEARRRKYERNEKGKRLKGPDIRMKTRHGAYKKLKKYTKRSEKAAQRVEATTAPPNLVRGHTDGSLTRRSRVGSRVTDQSTEIAAIDLANVTSSRSHDHTRNGMPSHPGSPVQSHNDDDGGHDSLEAARTSYRKRVDSGETLVQPSSATRDTFTSSDRSESANLKLNGSPKMSYLPISAAIGQVARQDMPRMTTA